MAARSGQLELVFRRDWNQRTYLCKQFASYPYHICRPHYFAGDPPGFATIYVQSLAGGIYEGDRLALTADFLEGTRAHLTSQASTVVHSMDGAGASQAVAINARADSFVEYMPDPVILFPAADLSTRLTVNVHPSACVLLSEALLFHDPAGARRSFSRLFSETTIVGPDRGILARDRFLATGEETVAAVPGLSGRFKAFGSFFLLAPEGAAERCLAPIGEALQSVSGTYAGVSKLPNGCGMWARVLASDAHELRRAITAAWSAARVLMLGRPPMPRRK